VAGTDEDKAATDTKAERPASAGDRLAARRAAKAARKAAERGTAPALNEAVAANVEAATSWYSGHQTSLWLVTGAVLLVGGGAYALTAHFANQRAEAAALLAQATTTALAPVIEGDNAALLENVDESYPTAKARAEQVMTHYKALAKAFPESRVTSSSPWPSARSTWTPRRSSKTWPSSPGACTRRSRTTRGRGCCAPWIGGTTPSRCSRS
jgi:hypothetical protein